MRPYRKQLEKIFCRKLGRELDQFKQQMMEKEKEEILLRGIRALECV